MGQNSEMIEIHEEIDVASLLNIIPYIPYKIVKEIGKIDQKDHLNNITKLQGTILFIDIVQFATLVFSFINDKNNGVEHINKILSGYYSELILPIRSFGGTVYQFAGDSILVGFEQLENESSEENIDRALSAVSVFFMNLEIFNRDYMAPLNRNIMVRIGISFGSYSQIILGSKKHSYTAAIIGRAVSEALNAENNIKPNQICISDNLYKIKKLSGDPKSSDSNYMILHDNYFESVDFHEELNIPELLSNDYFYQACKDFINYDIFKRALSGYEILNSEHREITCLLISFDGTHYETDLEESVKNLNDFYIFVQDEADRYGGVLLNPDLSDKGNVLIIVFGAPVAMEKKELLTVQLALKLKKEQKRFNFINTLHCGISTGKAYCGDFGTTIRKEYSIIGNVINIAARLMTISDGVEILVDEITKSRLNEGYNTEQLGAIDLKGINRPINIFKVLKNVRLNIIKENVNLGLKIIGREKELSFLTDKYFASINKNSNCTGIIADSGVGKSLLVSTYLNKMDIVNAKIIIGRCFLFEKNTLFYIWREFFYSFFGLTNIDNDKSNILKVKDLLQQDLSEGETPWAPLLLRLMGFEIEESDFTISISPGQKEVIFFKLICKLIIQRSKKNPLILYFEDIHWLDDKSSDLLKYIIYNTAENPIQIIYTSRNDSFVKVLKGVKHFEPLFIGNLGYEDAMKLVQITLKLDIPNKSLEEKIVKSSGRNPFYIDTIIKSIKESNLLDCDETGTYFINGDINDIDIPDSIKDVILSRVDRLPSKEQLIIKTASVIGHIFSSEVLIELLKKDILEGSSILQSLKILGNQGLINLEDLAIKTYMFKHMTIRDVVYQTLMSTTQTKLNLELAFILENNSSNSIYSNSERLAKYYYHGQKYEKAFYYYIKSAEKAKALFATNDVIYNYKKALEICDKQYECEEEDNIFKIKMELIITYRIAGIYDFALESCNKELLSPHRPINKAKLYKEMGHVFQEKGEIIKSIKICEDALSLFGHNIPHNKKETYISIFKQLFIKYIKISPSNNKLSDIEVEQNTIEVEILHILTKIYYFDILEKTLWATIKIYNISKKIQNISQLALSGSEFGLTMASIGFKNQGLKHLTKSMELSENLTNPLINAVIKSRMAIFYLIHNDPSKSIELLNSSIITYRNIGEMWELMTALGTIGQTFYNICEYEKCMDSYNEIEQIAIELNSVSLQSWAKGRVPYLKYIKGEISYDEVKLKLLNAVEVSVKAKDLMNVCGVYSHLIEMAIIEKNIDDIAAIIPEIIKYNLEYSADIPHIRQSLIYALEGSTLLEVNAMVKINKTLIPWLNKLSRRYKSLKAPYLRVKSIYYKTLGKDKKSKNMAYKSQLLLENTPYKKEYAISLLTFSKNFPLTMNEYQKKAINILSELGIKRY